MDTLSEGYVQAVDRLDAGAGKEALDAYRAKYLVTVKTIYSETATNQPGKFEKMADWSEWARGLYIQSVQTDKALGATPVKASADWTKARGKLESLRAHFASLHKETDMQTSGDYIFALREECRKEQPDVAVLKKIQAALDKAPVSKAAKAKPDTYATARAEWNKAVTPLLEKGAIPKESLVSLRAAADKFYLAFGVQLE